MKIVIGDIFLKWMQSMRKTYLIFIKIYHFYQKEKKPKNVISLFATYKTKKNMLFTEQALNHELILKKVHGVIQFNQKAWLRPYININTEFRKKATNEFEKDFFQLMNNSVFGKTVENVRKHRDT